MILQNPLSPANAGVQIKGTKGWGRRRRPAIRRTGFSIWIPAFAGMCGLFMAASAALADPVELAVDPVDEDGQITLGELFDGAGSAAGVFVADRVGPTAVLDAGQVQSLARRAGLEWSNSRGLRRIVVRQGSAAPSAASAASPAVARAGGETVEVLTYARSLAAGDIVQPEDVVWTPMQAHLAPSGAPRDAEAVIGLSARRALRAGAAVADRDLAAPQVIARNDMVKVSYESGGISLTLTGRATQDASAGDTVTITNLQSDRTIQAVAIAPGRAVAGPAAQAARGDPQFASR